MSSSGKGNQTAASRELFYAYWQGFTPSGTGPTDSPPLGMTPEYVDIVALAFAAPGVNSTVDTGYLTKANSKASILADAKTLQSRGTKILISINGNPDVSWSTLDPDTFATNVEALAEDWNLDGIDLDNESPDEVPGSQFAEVVQAVRDKMGPQFLITYPAFLTWRDAFLPQVKDALSYVMTMAYWNEANVAESLYEDYANMVGPEKVMMGIKPGYNYSNQSTPIDAVAPICKYEPTGTQKAGVMLYSLSIDIPHYTQKQRFSWCCMVNQNLPGQPPSPDCQSLT